MTTGGTTVRRLSPGTYVLTQFEKQTASPFVTFDHACGGTRIQQMVMADTIALGADGEARRAFGLTTALNGVMNPMSRVEVSGTWQSFDASQSYYFSAAPTIVLSTSVGGAALSGYYRVDSPTTITTIGSAGGSCTKDPSTDPQTDSRDVVMIYTKQQ